VNSIARSDPHSLQEVLLARCVAGDERAWQALHGRFAGTVSRFLHRLGVPADSLDDAAQEVFLEAFRALPSFRGEAALKTWLYRLSVTQARRSRRLTRFTQRLRRLLLLEARDELDWGAYDPRQADRIVQDALSRLSTIERETFVLYEIEGQSGAQIAAILDCPEATVYRRLHDARKKFQNLIENGGRSRDA